MSVEWADVDPSDVEVDEWWRDDDDGEESEDTTCPTCGRDDFKSWRGVKVHHAQVHNESLVYVESECVICGSSYEIHESKTDERNCCSYDCAAEYRSRHMAGEDSPAWKGGEVELECEWCGGTYTKCRALADESRFCSPECKWEHESEYWVGPNNPMWNGGNPDYGVGWTDKKKERVRERDGYECQDCGMTQEEHLEERGRDLEVHHIRKAKAFDSDEKRNAMENLITLCYACHPKWEKMSPLRPAPESD